MNKLLLFILPLLVSSCQIATNTDQQSASFILAEEDLPDYESNIDHKRFLTEPDEETYFRGMKVYNGVCFDCHGNKEIVGSLPTAIQFWQDTFKVGSDPYSMYQTITKGYGLMPPQVQLSPQEKYDVIQYIQGSFFKEDNPDVLQELTAAYLDKLPKGNSLGPAPEEDRPWSDMDYGDFWINTYELAGQDAPPRNMSTRNAPLKDEDWSWANWAYKGVAVRLDQGEGGIAAGKSWMIFDHDLLRVAGGWSGQGFIDWNEILMDGKHNISPRTVGDLHFSNPTKPGWSHPITGTFEDPRFKARDGRQFGPLPKAWGRLKGIYHHEHKVILAYSVGEASILEYLSVEYYQDSIPVYIRNLEISNAPIGLQAHLAPGANHVSLKGEGAQLVEINGHHYLNINQAGDLRLKIGITIDEGVAQFFASKTQSPMALSPFTGGGQKHYPEILRTQVSSQTHGAFDIDELTAPKLNKWKSRLRFGGIDFFEDANKAVAVCTEGDIWIIEGLLDPSGQLSWKRIGSGMFQPLGVKVIDEQIYVTCRDQLVRLHDLNGDDEIDFYECFNGDHQVTDHFHEFAMGLQADEAGNFYYAKSGRHAREALVPQHGTLIKVSPDGSSSEIIAYGFRAANGVCLNPDGSFIVTDQEGYWNPMNRVNWIDKNAFYGNMWGYNAPKDSSDKAMVQPLVWIDSKVDRSPSELLWVDSQKWGPLNGSLLNLSYGYGKIYLIPHERVNNQIQGGIVELPIPPFKTGLIRGRFNPSDGQLYVCGMSAWATNQVYEPGGFYRIRYNEDELNLPIVVKSYETGVLLKFSAPVAYDLANDLNSYKVTTWDLKRSRKYGSDRYNVQTLVISNVQVQEDGQSVFIGIPEIKPTWQMEIAYALKSANGIPFKGKVLHTIHQLQTIDKHELD